MRVLSLCVMWNIVGDFGNMTMFQVYGRCTYNWHCRRQSPQQVIFNVFSTSMDVVKFIRNEFHRLLWATYTECLWTLFSLMGKSYIMWLNNSKNDMAYLCRYENSFCKLWWFDFCYTRLLWRRSDPSFRISNAIRRRVRPTTPFSKNYLYRVLSITLLGVLCCPKSRGYSSFEWWGRLSVVRFSWYSSFPSPSKLYNNDVEQYSIGTMNRLYSI